MKRTLFILLNITILGGCYPAAERASLVEPSFTCSEESTQNVDNSQPDRYWRVAMKQD